MKDNRIRAARGRARPAARGLVAGLALTLMLGAAACGSSTSAAGRDATRGVTVTLVTHDSFAVSKKVLKDFEASSGIKVRLLQSGDAGAALNQVILTRDHPLGDAFFGVDNTFLSRAVDQHVFAPYTPRALARVPNEFKLDSTHELTPIDHGDVCVNTDRKWFTDHHLSEPTSFADLAQPAYKGMLAVENPATSSPGLVFLLATIAHYGPHGWQTYWKALRTNDVKIDDSWDAAYSTDFSGSSGHGAYPLVVSYASSPPAEVLAATPEPPVAPTGVMVTTCFRQIEFAGVLRGAAHPAAARIVVDWMLSPSFQADMPLQMYVYPVVPGTPLPSVFTRFAVIPPSPLVLPAREIGTRRDEWIKAWTSIALR